MPCFDFEPGISSGVSRTLGNSTPGLSEAEKLAVSGEKSHLIISRETDFRAETKKRYFVFVSALKSVPLEIHGFFYKKNFYKKFL